MKAFTHAGILRKAMNGMGNDHWTLLRESPNWWTDKGGDKYRKVTGWRMKEPWPQYKLDLASIIPLAEYNARRAAKGLPQFDDQGNKIS